MYTTTMWAVMLGCLVVATGAMHMVNKLDSKVNPATLALEEGNTCAAGCRPCGVANAASYSSNCLVDTCNTGFRPSANSETCEDCQVADAVEYSSGCQVASCIDGMKPSADRQSCEVGWRMVWFFVQRANTQQCYGRNTLYSFQDAVTNCIANDNCKYIYDWGCGMEASGVGGEPTSVLQTMDVPDTTYRLCGTESDAAISQSSHGAAFPGGKVSVSESSVAIMGEAGRYQCALMKPGHNPSQLQGQSE